MKLIVSKLAYWPGWIAIANRKSSKATIPTQVYCSIYYHAIYRNHSIYTMHFPRSTVKCGIAEFGMHFCLNEKDFIAIIIHSKRRSVYFSGYKWIVNTLPLTKSSIGVARSANLAHRKPVSRGHQSGQLSTRIQR